MPRAMCINDNFGKEFPDAPRPVLYQDYIVLDELVCPCGCGEQKYRFYEFGPLWLYSTSYFVLLDGGDEVAIAGERMKEKVWTKVEKSLGWDKDNS